MFGPSFFTSNLTYLLPEAEFGLFNWIPPPPPSPVAYLPSKNLDSGMLLLFHPVLAFSLLTAGSAFLTGLLNFGPAEMPKPFLV
jgi:hypothetical protein